MKKITAIICVVLGLVLLNLPLKAQFANEEVSEFGKWEEFLKTAKIVSSDQMRSREAVTSPWILTLEKDGITKKALWKNPKGRTKGFIEGWQWEIAAYRISNLLQLYMVPPTVERRFNGDRGSIQLWVDDSMTMKIMIDKKIKPPSYKVAPWNKKLYLQRAFDNLIANTDRHPNQYLITEDFRMLLIDHSRSFGTSKKNKTQLVYSEKTKEGPTLMKKLPKAFFLNIQALTFESVQTAVEDYLKEKEINAVLLRRDLVVSFIEKRCKELGEEQVIY